MAMPRMDANLYRDDDLVSLIFDMHEIERDLRPRPLMSGPVRRPPATMPQAAIPTEDN